MKICLSSQGNTLDSQVDPRFGRCQYFIIVDTETLAFEAIKNQNIDAMGVQEFSPGNLLPVKKFRRC